MMNVRLAQNRDIGPLQDAIRKADAEVSSKFGCEPAAEWLAETVASAVREGQGVVVATDDDENLVGYVAWVALPNSPPGVVHGLGTWVAPGARRSGIATQMRALAASWWKWRGAKYVEGVAATDNNPGLRSAEHVGFRISGYVVRLDLQGGAA